MKRILYILGGAVFLLLGIAKVVGLFFALTAHSPTPANFTVKQVIYTVGLIGAGVAMLFTRPRLLDEPCAANASHEASQ
jgi:hypothetical protein